MYYDDDVIIETALDLYDRYDISMEDAVGIAMEKTEYTNEEKAALMDATRSGMKKGAKYGAGIGAGLGVISGASAAHSLNQMSKMASPDASYRVPVVASGIASAPINAVGGLANGAIIGAGVGYLKKRSEIKKNRLAKAAELERQAREAEAKAAAKREEAENAVAQAKEAASYFAY